MKRFFISLVTMGDTFQRVFVIFHETGELRHRVEPGKIGFERLFHGRNNHFFKAILLDDFAFGVIAK